jgi:hypothetical protein
VEISSKPLSKVYNVVTDKYEWEVNDIASATQNNINQLEIPITYGESVIIQVRAITEAGYPSNPKKSEWSDELRIEFPTSLAQDETISAIVSKNAEDEQTLKLDTFLEQKGVNIHITESFQTSEQYFSHKTVSIDSGFKESGAVLNLFTFLSNLNSRISILEETLLRQTVSWSVEILDSRGNSYPVTDRASLKLFAGYYSESVDINDSSNYGEVATETFYLRITNNSASAGDLLTLSSGNLTARTIDSGYTSSPFQTFTSPLNFQKNGQIFYLRSTDLQGANDLYVAETTTSSNVVTASDIDLGAVSTQQNVVSWDGVTASVVALLSGANSTNYVALLKTHPLFIQYLALPNAANLQLLSDEFDRIANLTSILRNEINQRDYDTLVVPRYLTDDKYLVGAESCGAMLFVEPQTQESVQVDTSDSSSPYVIEGGKSINVPIKFQFRCLDAVGRLNGDGTVSLAGGNTTYTKKIGIDLYAGSKMSFDIEVSASFRPTIQSGKGSSSSTPIITSTNDTNVIL